MLNCVWVALNERLSKHCFEAIFFICHQDRRLHVTSVCFDVGCNYFSGKVKQCSTGPLRRQPSYQIYWWQRIGSTSDMFWAAVCHYGSGGNNLEKSGNFSGSFW